MDPVNIPAKFEIRRFTHIWDNRGYLKNWGVPGYANAPFSPKFLKAFWSDKRCEYIPAKFEVRSFTRWWDNKGYCKNLGSPWVRPRTLFSQIFNGLLFALTLWIYLSNLKFVALCVPEIIGGILKNWEVPGYAHGAFSPKFLTGFCSDGPCEYSCQIWSL